MEHGNAGAGPDGAIYVSPSLWLALGMRGCCNMQRMLPEIAKRGTSGYIEPPSPVEAANAISLWAKEIGARASKENDLIEEASHWPSCERGEPMTCEPMTCSFEECDTEAYESMTCSLKL